MRTAFPAMFGVVLALTTAWAQAGEPGDKTLRLYNWSDYIGENTLAGFEKAT
ncbi:spermidine/putrescine ABC transporter substrate-binding protein PotF, partial [Pseudomonas sp. SIMBA_077]